MIRFFSAAFGEAYVTAAQGLLRSFDRFAPESDLRLFTDLPQRFDARRAVETHFDDLLAEMDEFHRSSDGQYRNAFKFRLFKRMQERYPSDDICWIDADMLVFCELARCLVPGRINVMAHGRRDDQVIQCGDGLAVPGHRYAIGGMYSLPPGPALAYALKATSERPTWTDIASLVRRSGDQITLNHVVARSGVPVHWLTDDRSLIFNLEVGDQMHPVVGDPGLAAIRLDNGRPVRGDRQIAVFYWIKSKLDAHLVDGFSTFQPEVAAFLADLYRAEPA